MALVVNRTTEVITQQFLLELTAKFVYLSSFNAIIYHKVRTQIADLCKYPEKER